MKLSFLILFFLVLSGASEGAEPSGVKSPSIRKQQGAPTDEIGNKSHRSIPSPPATIIINNPTNPSEKNPPQKEPEPWPPLWAIWTGLVITGCASAIALWTLTFIKQQADAALIQARAAESTVNLAQAQFNVVNERERPWLMLSNPKWEMAKDWSSGLISPVDWSIKNVGRSPAFLTQLATIVDVLELPVPEKCPDYPVNKSFAKFIIPPDGIHASTKKVVGVTQLQGIFNGTHCFIFYGRVVYRDGLDREHYTKFCCYWHIENGAWIYEPVGPPDWVDYT